MGKVGKRDKSVKLVEREGIASHSLDIGFKPVSGTPAVTGTEQILCHVFSALAKPGREPIGCCPGHHRRHICLVRHANWSNSKVDSFQNIWPRGKCDLAYAVADSPTEAPPDSAAFES
jgi:hypothetical protein